MNGKPAAGLHCPGCDEPAVLILASGRQAFCGNEDCAILMWDPSKSIEENAADMYQIDLRRLL